MAARIWEFISTYVDRHSGVNESNGGAHRRMHIDTRAPHLRGEAVREHCGSLLLEGSVPRGRGMPRRVRA